LEKNQNPLSAAEVDLVQTSCRILGIDSDEMVNKIGRKAVERGQGQVQKVMSLIMVLLDELGARVKAHKRGTPGPAMSTRTYNDMDTPARSLAHLQACAKGLRDMMVGGLSRGIKMAKMALENAMKDFWITLERMGEAARWKQDIIDSWLEKGQQVCGDMLAEAVEAIHEAEEREAKEVRIRLMETSCDKLASLIDRVEKQAIAEMEPEPLIELGEEIEYRRENMANLAKMLKGNIHEEFKERAQRALDESAKMAKEGQRRLGDLRARLEFRSFDSEAVSYKGQAPRVREATPEGCPLIENLVRRPENTWTEGGAGAGDQPASPDIAALLRGWGQPRGNDSGWPEFDGQYASYLRFKKEWVAYRETYHSVMNDNLAAKTSGRSV
jgi:hypothetical protein